MAMNKKGSKKVAASTGSPSNAVYGLGMIGSFIYYLHFHSGTFWLVVLAVLKAIVWPAFVVYHLLVLMHL